MLREFLLREPRDGNVGAKHDRARRRSALVDGKHKGHGGIFPAASVFAARQADWNWFVNIAGARIASPSRGGGGSARMSAANCERGWGAVLSPPTLFARRECPSTPPRIAFASTLPLQGRVRNYTD